jgi:uncharacterized protein involved in outer membrane biogenesis
MKKVLRWVISIIGVIILFCVALLTFKDPLLKKLTERRIERETGLKATIEAFDSDLGTASVRIRHLKVFNTPEFGGSVLLHAPELYLRLDPSTAFSDQIRFEEARVSIAEFNVVKNAQGKTNIFEVQRRISQHSKSNNRSQKTEREFGGIGELHVTLGAAHYRDMGNPSNHQDFELNVQDEVVTTIKSEKDFERWGTGFLLRLAVQQVLLKSQTDPRLLDSLRRSSP